jgi:hypothetical protein
MQSAQGYAHHSKIDQIVKEGQTDQEQDRPQQGLQRNL